MSQTAVIVLVLVVVVVVVAIAVYVWLSVRKRRQRAAMTPEERELQGAQKHYDEAVAQAKKTLQTTTEAWVKPAKVAENTLTDAHNIGSRPLGSYEKVHLFEDHIETPQGAFRFGNGAVEATVDTARNLAGTKQSVLSRAEKEVFEELVSRSSKSESAQSLYLLIETPIFVTLLDVAADDEATARQFSLSVTSAAGSGAGLEEKRNQSVSQAQADLDRIRADRDAAVTAAQAELDAVTANTQRLEAARAAVEEAAAQPTPPR